MFHPTLNSIILTNSFKKTKELRESLRLIYVRMFDGCNCGGQPEKSRYSLKFVDECLKCGKDVRDSTRLGMERRISAEICPCERLSLKKKLELKRKQSEKVDEALARADSVATIKSRGISKPEEARFFPLLAALAERR